MAFVPSRRNDPQRRRPAATWLCGQVVIGRILEEQSTMIDKELRGDEVPVYFEKACNELDVLWKERKHYLDRGQTVPDEIERQYWRIIARILYVGAHMDQQSSGGHIPPGVALEAAHAIDAAVKGHPSPAFRSIGGTVPGPEREASERIAVELVMLAGYGEVDGGRTRPAWLKFAGGRSAFVDMVADRFGVTRTTLARWVRKYEKSIGDVVRRAIGQRVAAGLFASREDAAHHDLDIASAHYRAWRCDAQRRSTAAGNKKKILK
jgi:hypothetical protein